MTDIVGSEEFVDAAIHRLGDTGKRLHTPRVVRPDFNAEAIVAAVEAVFGLSREGFCNSGKNARAIMAKEVLILSGRESGATFGELTAITGLDSSNISRRYDAAKQNATLDPKLNYAKNLVDEKYRKNIAESQV